MSDAAQERLQLAKDALVATGYFAEYQVTDDIAPRIIELAHYYANRIAGLEKQHDAIGEKIVETGQSINDAKAASDNAVAQATLALTGMTQKYLDNETKITRVRELAKQLAKNKQSFGASVAQLFLDILEGEPEKERMQDVQEGSSNLGGGSSSILDISGDG